MRKINILVYVFLFIVIILAFKICYSTKFYFKKQIEDDYYILKKEKDSNFEIVKLIDNDWEYMVVLVIDVVEVYKDGKYIEILDGSKYKSLIIGETNYPDDIKEIKDISIDVKKRIFFSLENDSH
jgi:hypothetical protein